MQLLQLLEEGDPPASGVIGGAFSGHLPAVLAVLGHRRVERGTWAQLRPLVGAVIAPVRRNGALDRDAETARACHPPKGAPLVQSVASPVPRRQLLRGHVREQGPAEVLGHRVDHPLQRGAVLELGARQYGMGDRGPVGDLKGECPKHSFTRFHFRPPFSPQP